MIRHGGLADPAAPCSVVVSRRGHLSVADQLGSHDRVLFRDLTMSQAERIVARLERSTKAVTDQQRDDWE